MKATYTYIMLGLAMVLVEFAPVFAETAVNQPAKHLDLSAPPINPNIIEIPLVPPSSAAATAQLHLDNDDGDDEDDLDDTKTLQAIVPHVEEDSAGALDDMGDDGGDFEE